MSRPTRRRATFAAAVIATVIAIILLDTAQFADAHGADPTYAEDVAPILFKNCASCHHPGGMGPFSVLDYDTTKAHVEDIRDAVDGGVMPPWHAAGAHGVFRNDRRLSDADKRTILRWIETGAKAGDMKRLPPLPVFPSGWSIGAPDAVVDIGEDFVVPASGTVEYQYFQVKTNFTEDHWVEAIEIIPGAPEVVHHALISAYAPPAAAPAAQAGATTAPATPVAPLFIFPPTQKFPDVPRLDSVHPRPMRTGSLIASYVPGTRVNEFPEGTAILVKAGTLLTFQMHYTAHGHEMKDRTKIGFRFAKAPPTEEMRATAFYNGQLTLPAGASNVEVPADFAVSRPIRVWGLMPHTHLRGVRWSYTLEKPDGTSEVILDVPKYDFNWQTFYMFAKPLELQPGMRLVSRAWYDNSATNPHNPDPKKEVRWGDQTWEEMQYTGFLYSIPRAR